MPEQQMSEEQVKELQEKIKNMSPEELKEFQKKQCIFCHIIEGKVQSKKIYEDDKCLAILDINPSNPGHILLLPKEHYSIMPQVPEDEIAHLFMITKTLSNAALRGLGVQGTNIIVQNGVAAGQKAQHFMVHIIPRKEEDGLNFDIPQKKIPEEELEAIRKKMASQLGEVKEQAPKPNVQELIKPKENVVEADFEESQKFPISEGLETKSQSKKTEEKPGEPEEKDEPKKKEKPQPEKQKPAKQKPPKETSEEVSLDNIADILGVK
jgi:histidine triad (HIT) family protein